MPKLLVFFAAIMAPVFLPSVGPGAGTYGGGGNVIASIQVDAQGRIRALTTTAGGGGGSVTADSPLAGDGSSGNHLRCSACALTTTTVSAGSGLSGGGDLSTNRTLTLNLANANTWTGSQTVTNGLNVSNDGAAVGMNFSTAYAANSGNLSVSTSAGDFSVGGKIWFTRPCTVVGALLYYPDTTSRSVKVVLWDSGGSNVASATNTYNTAGIKVVTFSSPYSVATASTWKDFYLTFRDTSGTSYWSFAGSGIFASPAIFPIFVSPVFMRAGSNYGYFHTGDAAPNSNNGSFFPVDPIVTVP